MLHLSFSKGGIMKKILSTFALLAFLAIPQGAFAWSYDGIGSLNPFTNFGRGFGGDGCGCKVERCQKRKLTKCEKLHGVKLIRGTNCGCAAPVQPIYMETNCAGCHRAF